MGDNQKRHLVLVHGICHGAWCWYKLQTLLEDAGYRVSNLDMSASGIDPKSLADLSTFPEYTDPLLNFMESIPSVETVVLIGHSLAGMNLAFAMEKYPKKVSLAIFIAAIMPDAINKPSFVLEEYFSRIPPGAFMDSHFPPFGRPENKLMAINFGPQYMEATIYSRSPPEDRTLANNLVRPGCFFMEDLSKRKPFSNDKYGSVKRAFIIAGATDAEHKFYRWEIENFEVPIVKEMDKETTDHMAMISNPKTLCRYILDIVENKPN
ncbi:salicylic acid-binding protein 2-like [Olea europaea var. sylvestris]|uniref:salicylic acid-binding protein 2-like n=1 Tax=Olea europaea var. sylvestris TaxID=158386 RepID=UPI000C1D3398|nr:salicylic acid-binding protein 2-like [Olea europaea var. sylvestris]